MNNSIVEYSISVRSFETHRIFIASAIGCVCHSCVLVAFCAFSLIYIPPILSLCNYTTEGKLTHAHIATHTCTHARTHTHTHTCTRLHRLLALLTVAFADLMTDLGDHGVSTADDNLPYLSFDQYAIRSIFPGTDNKDNSSLQPLGERLKVR